MDQWKYTNLTECFGLMVPIKRAIVRHATVGSPPKDRKRVLGCACWLADAKAISALECARKETQP